MKTKQVKKGVLHLGYFFLVCKIANAKHVSCMLLNKEEPTYFALGYFTLFMFYTECSRIIVIATMSLQKKNMQRKTWSLVVLLKVGCFIAICFILVKVVGHI